MMPLPPHYNTQTMQNKQQHWPPHPPHPQHQHPAPPLRGAAHRVGTGAATKRENGNTTEGKQRQKARGTSIRCPLGCWYFFFFSFHYFVANKVFYTGFIYVTTTLHARGRDDEAAKGRPTTTQQRGDEERRKGKKAQGKSMTSLGP